jgi:cobalt-zinc-cadmium efflux system membrane fusion protein
MRGAYFCRVAAAVTLLLFASGCDGTPSDSGSAHEEKGAQAEFERGPHRGRMLRSGTFALEITIFETGVPPQFRVYPYSDGEPVDPKQVRLAMQVSRLGGRIDRFAFTPKLDHLDATSTVKEPHSFDVIVTAEYNKQRHSWTYATYEGRTTIAAEAANAAGVRVEIAGPAVIDETIDLAGRVDLRPDGKAEVRARYPGRIVSMTRTIGEAVKRGETLARIEASESLQTYSIAAPFSGVVLTRGTNVGDVAGADPLYVLADLTKLHAELFVYPRDAERVRVGQKVEVRSLSGERRVTASIEALPPMADPATQTLIAHVELPPDDGRSWRPGSAVEGTVVVATENVALAVRTKALQRFRDFTVVYARYGNTYEVRMLELGRQTPEWTEVLGGLEAGTPYVTDNAFLIRADVEKSGASHDH